MDRVELTPKFIESLNESSQLPYHDGSNNTFATYEYCLNTNSNLNTNPSMWAIVAFLHKQKSSNFPNIGPVQAIMIRAVVDDKTNATQLAKILNKTSISEDEDIKLKHEVILFGTLFFVPKLYMDFTNSAYQGLQTYSLLTSLLHDRYMWRQIYKLSISSSTSSSSTSSTSSSSISSSKIIHKMSEEDEIAACYESFDEEEDNEEEEDIKVNEFTKDDNQQKILIQEWEHNQSEKIHRHLTVCDPPSHITTFSYSLGSEALQFILSRSIPIYTYCCVTLIQQLQPGLLFHGAHTSLESASSYNQHWVNGHLQTLLPIQTMKFHRWYQTFTTISHSERIYSSESKIGQYIQEIKKGTELESLCNS